LAFFSAYTDRLGLLVFGGNTLRWVGAVLFTVGGFLRLWPAFVLGRRFSGLVAIQEHHTLVTDGIYSRIRNPSYLGLLVNMLGWALTFRSGVGVLLTALTIPILIARITSEERLLRGHFGAEYCPGAHSLSPKKKFTRSAHASSDVWEKNCRCSDPKPIRDSSVPHRCDTIQMHLCGTATDCNHDVPARTPH
jgi:hypothetical protein